jgi:membrane-associated phospholipid phosphatase
MMPLVLVWAGEHYVVDTLLGAGYAVAVVLLAKPVRRALEQTSRRAALAPDGRARANTVTG